MPLQLYAGLSLAQVQQVPLNLSISEKGTPELVKLTGRLLLNNSIIMIDTIEPVISRAQRQLCLLY